MNSQLPRWIGASIVLGALLGLLCNMQVDSGAMDRTTVLWLAGRGEWLGKIFLSLLSMVVVPLVFSSVFAAITSVAEQRSAASLGARTVGWYLSSSALATPKWSAVDAGGKAPPPPATHLVLPQFHNFQGNRRVVSAPHVIFLATFPRKIGEYRIRVNKS